MRYPAVSGSFYPSSPEGVRRQVDAYLKEARQKIGEMQKGKKHAAPPIAVVVPHAGYAYSGKTAAYSFAAVEERLKGKNVVVLFFGPNHTGIGKAPVSVSFEDWMTPVGKSETDLEVAGAFLKECKIAQRDESAHLREHSIEVQMPLLQIINPLAKVVCIALNMQNYDVAKAVGEAAAKVVKEKRFANRSFVAVASSDFTHYESAESAKKKDIPAIERIMGFDVAGFETLVEKFDLSICGHAPVAAAAVYAKEMGAKGGKLLRYTNSGEEQKGIDEKVVAYASIGFYK